MNLEENVNYCLSCKTKPCKLGCPLNNDVTEAIAWLKKGDELKAYETFAETSVLMGMCGRICPHEFQCQGKCVRGIKGEPVAIGEIETYLADKFIDVPYKKSDELSDYKVAVIGAGPAGLSCAGFLAKKGIKVTIFEKHDHLGGIMYHGIPEFRLPKDILNRHIQKIIDLGIEVKLNTELGKDFSLDDLSSYDAVFLSFGANLSRKMNIPGEERDNVLFGNELLESGSWPDVKGKKIAVSGGGNTAMDVCRSAKLKGGDVTVIYRRSEKEMPATRKEIADAKAEGIEFMFQTNILEVKENTLHCIKTELIQKEGEKRLSPVNIEGSDFEFDYDYIIMAVGSKPDSELTSKLGLELTKWGSIVKDENLMSSKEAIFVGGDLADNKSTVAFAGRSGRDAAEKIIDFLQKK